jgi:hypothetical protein
MEIIQAPTEKLRKKDVPESNSSKSRRRQTSHFLVAIQFIGVPLIRNLENEES